MLKHGAKPFAIYVQHMAVLAKHRGKGQAVRRSGGQAIVGHVEHGRAAGRTTKGCGAKPKRLSAPTCGAQSSVNMIGCRGVRAEN